MFTDSDSVQAVTGLPFQTGSGHGAGLDQMALVPESPSQEVSPGGAAGSSAMLAPPRRIHPGYPGPTSGGAGGSSLVEARPGVEETSDAAECSSGTLGPPSAAAGEHEGAGC